jgi:hypothetical protein
VTAAGQDGERLVTEEMVSEALRSAWNAGANQGSLNLFEMRDALTAVAPDIAVAERDRIRRECAEELRRTHRSSHAVLGVLDERGHERRNRCITDGQNWPCIDEQTAAEWSASGRAPADKEAT